MMIEINLMPSGGRARRGRKGGRSSKRAPGRLPLRLRALDGWVVSAAASVAGAVALCLFLLVSAGDRAAEQEAALARAIEDSTKVAERSRAWDAFQQRRDSILRRMTLIENLDARRYAWPHLLDEISVAVPTGVWLTRIAAIPDEGDRVRFLVEGNAPDHFTLTRFWNALESSFFIRDVHLVRTEHIVVPPLAAPSAAGTSLGASPAPHIDSGPAPVYEFVLEAIEEVPPDDVLDLAPVGRAAPERAHGTPAISGQTPATESVT